MLWLATAAAAAAALATAAPLPLPDEPWLRRLAFDATEFPAVLRVPDASAVRAAFDPAATRLPAGAAITVTSLADGASQRLDAAALARWGFSTAFFNGDALEIRIDGQATAARVVIDRAVVAPRRPIFPESICGPHDSRIFSNDTRNARYIFSDPNGCCTAWSHVPVAGGGSQFMSAGHCTGNTGLPPVVQWNVPLSNPDGTLVQPHPDDQFPVDASTIQFVNGGRGRDWQTLCVGRNALGELPEERFRIEKYELAIGAPIVAGDVTVITGFGENEGFPLEERRVQKTASGAIASASGTSVSYTADTSNGNSGSAIYLPGSNRVVGIHAFGGCSSTGGSNSGTSFESQPLLDALYAPRGECA